MDINLVNLKKQINKSPNKPGVYVFKNSRGSVLYVGKAIKLKQRLKSYVDKTTLLKSPKTLKMVSLATKVEYFLTNTEVEALILEANLIKKYKPKYNINLKDDKYYKYIQVQRQKDGSLKVATARKKAKKASYFGPFPSGSAVNTVLRNIRKIIPYRDCSNTKFNLYKKRGVPCLYGQIGLCVAPCQGPSLIKQNNTNVLKIKRFLKGESKKVIKDLKKQMALLSKNQQYEEAAKIRDNLNYYNYLSEKYKSETELMLGVGEIEKGGRFLLMLVKILSSYFSEFKKYTTIEDVKNFNIEFFDISNLGTDIIVGSSISLVNEEYNKSNYRRYKIKNQTTQNDFSAIAQIVNRRLKNINKWGKPNLIVVDGGKGQLSAVLKKTKKYNIPTIGLAKKQETIVVKTKDGFKYVSLPKNFGALNVLIKGRNEVHRFGLNYNKHLRKIKK